MYKILDKLVIIEFTAFIAGPLVGQIFNQLGANVIRIDPSNNPVDKDRFPIDENGNSYYWAELNKGKKLLNINYRDRKLSILHFSYLSYLRLIKSTKMTFLCR